MAWLEKRGQKFLLVFRLNGSRYKKLLDLKERREADAVAAKVDRRIEMLERGEWQLPDPANVVDSLVEDIAPRPVVPLPTGKTLGTLIDEYLPTVSTGSLESNSLGTLTTHLNHVRRVMRPGLRVESISFANLQKYVDARSKDKGIRGKPLSTTTIRKELVSFGAMWAWALRMPISVSSPAPPLSVSFRFLPISKSAPLPPLMLTDHAAVVACSSLGVCYRSLSDHIGLLRISMESSNDSRPLVM